MIGQLAAETLGDKAGVARSRVHHFVDDVGVNALHEIFRVQVDIVDARRELRRVVVAQAVGVQMLAVLALIKVPRDLDIFAPLTVT